ncbi:MAG: DNA replication/repair protein RecF [Calditrichaeota bacterium]|nr:DNA replication/repair protein RecF [Calditrichota bacterium]
MTLTHLEIISFRNIEQVRLDFTKTRNLFFGDNAQGKTNVIEAIYILCLAKSFRAREDSDLVPFDKKEFTIIGKFVDAHGIKRRVVVFYSVDQGKKISLDGKRVAQFSKLIGQFPVVVLSSDDFEITGGPPSQRRRFFNIFFSQSSQRYLQDLKEYERALKQRNNILSSMALGKTISPGILDIWSEQLISKGEALIKFRAKVIDEIRPHLSDNYRVLTNSSETLNITYQPNVPFKEPQEISHNFRSALLKLSPKEKKRGTSLAGPHRDEFSFSIGGKDLRRFGSRGEHKSVLVSLKATESTFLRQKTETEPILLLDDLYSELDKDRGKNVLDLFSAGSQVFITGTSFDYEAVKNIQDESVDKDVFFVNSGQVKRA